MSDYEKTRVIFQQELTDAQFQRLKELISREIGIKMALGAKPRLILGQFVFETLALTIVGGILGILITLGICAIFPVFNLTDFVGDPIISPSAAAATAVMLGLIGLVSGYFPARTASNLDPVVAMKM